jgi:hypothetical protein
MLMYILIYAGLNDLESYNSMTAAANTCGSIMIGVGLAVLVSFGVAWLLVKLIGLIGGKNKPQVESIDSACPVCGARIAMQVPQVHVCPRS